MSKKIKKSIWKDDLNGDIVLEIDGVDHPKKVIEPYKNTENGDHIKSGNELLYNIGSEVGITLKKAKKRAKKEVEEFIRSERKKNQKEANDYLKLVHKSDKALKKLKKD